PGSTLVSCHNVLIYLRPEIQSRVLATFYQALKPSGLLAVGRSESGGELFSPIGEPKHGIFAKRTGVTAPRAPRQPGVALWQFHCRVKRTRPCRCRIIRRETSNGRCSSVIRRPRCWWTNILRFYNSAVGSAPFSN